MTHVKITEMVDPRPQNLKIFYNGTGRDGLHLALADCQDNGFIAQYMPTIIDLRTVADKDHPIWNLWYSAPSVKATGTTKNGKNVVVYAHKPNPFAIPKNIEKELSTLRNGAGIGYDNEFRKLIKEQDNENVFVIPHEDFKDWPNGVYGIDEPTKEHMEAHNGKINGKDMIAINHPAFIPFIGGEKRAEPYLTQHKKVVGKVIGIYNSNDLAEKSVGWRLLFANSRGNLGDLGGYGYLYNFGRFVGVSLNGEAVPKKKSSRLEGIIGKATEVPGMKMLVIDGSKITSSEYDLLKGTYQ